MDWIILFAVSWVIFISLVDWKKLKTNIWCGLLAVALQLSIDTHSMSHGLYQIDNGTITFLGSSVFFILGPVLTIATLLAQYQPQKRWCRILNIFVLSALYSLEELLLLMRKDLTYSGWHYLDSIVVNTMVMVVLEWFAMVVLQKERSTVP